jgi:NADH-quinone oxidoreductase chain G
MINLIINNKPIIVKPGTTVLQACELANEEVPRFCYNDKLSIAGNCRMCLVEIEKSPKPVVSCAMPVMEGMRVYTNTPLAKKASEAVLEYLLINHPLDCPICDQGGECDLQDQTLAYGSDRSRFLEFKRGVEDKECGPIIKTIMTRCIHCTRCVRFTEEISGTHELGVINRGNSAEIGTYVNKFIKTELSGNLVDLCPVGALTSKPYAFSARNWELKKIESIDFLDAVGSNILINTRNSSITQTNTITHQKDEIVRILPRSNDNINEDWISDKTRYAFDGLRKQRLQEPAIFNKNRPVPIHWSEMLNYFTYYTKFNLPNNFKLDKSQKIGAIFGNLNDIESLYFFFQFLNELGSNNIQYSNNLYRLNIDIPLFYRFNTTIKDIESSDLILLIGVNPRFEASLVNVRIRKQYIKHHIPVALIGTPVDLTYNYSHLGSSTKTLIQICEGKHLFCKQLRQAKKPLIICGTEFLQRRDSEALINITRFLAQNITAYLKNTNNYNFLCNAAGQLNSFELGIQPGIRSSLHFIEKNNHLLDILYLLKAENIQSNKWLDFKTKNLRTKLFLHDSHITQNFNYADFIIPACTAYESNGLFINIEGRIQKAYKATSGSQQARNSMNFFQAIAKTLNFCSRNSMHNFNKANLFRTNPILKRKDNLNTNFHINFLNYKESKNKIYLSNFLPLIKNFYLTDNLSYNSQTLSECSLFLKDTRINYKKFKANN